MAMRVSLLVCLAAGLAWAATARAAEFDIDEHSDVVGEALVVAARHEDTFVKLAREHNVGYEELRHANPDVDAWLPGEGTPITIPSRFVLPRAERRGIVINLPELRLYYFPDDDDRRVITHPISIGRMDWSTPLGRTSVVAKAERPSWYPPESIREEHAARNEPLPRVVPPGPDNPLGEHALRLGIPGYLIHGTNKPSGVGMRVTHGCIRMFPEDIEGLFGAIPTGTQVRIVNQPFKLGWTPDGIYLEAHARLEEADEEAVEEADVEFDEESDEEFVEPEPESAATELTRAFVAATEVRGRPEEFDWHQAERIAQLASGVPEFVSPTGVVEDEESAPGADLIAQDDSPAQD